MVNFGAFLPVLAGLLSVVEAHCRVYSLWVNDVDQGDGRSKYIRSPPSNSPVKDVSKTDIICNVANTPVPSSVSVVAGDKITFEWYHDNRDDDIIASSHKGPITVYIAPASTNGAGAVWTKLAESGLSSGGVWAVDTLIANKGKYSFTLPSSLAAGDYLLRGEIIALHEADTDWTTNNARGAQFYPSCSQITVTSSGKSTPPGDYAFVGGYTPTGPGILYNLYGGLTTYPIPGPAVWDGTTSGSPSSAANPRSTVAPTNNGVPTPTMAAVPTTSTTTMATVPTTSTTTMATVPAATAVAPACPAQVVSPAESSTGVVAKYYQCGGKVYTGPTTCVSGTTCVQQNEYYFQCV